MQRLQCWRTRKHLTQNKFKHFLYIYFHKHFRALIQFFSFRFTNFQEPMGTLYKGLLQLCNYIYAYCLLQCLSVPIFTWSIHGTMSQNLATVSPFIGHYRRSSIWQWRRSFVRPKTLICLLPVWVVFGSSLNTCTVQSSQTGERVCLCHHVRPIYCEEIMAQSNVSDIMLW